MFVKNSTGVLKKVMVCPPTHLQLQPINEISRDWINKGENDSQRETALREWGEFVQAYKDNGVEVVEVTPDPNEPLTSAAALPRVLLWDIFVSLAAVPNPQYTKQS